MCAPSGAVFDELLRKARTREKVQMDIAAQDLHDAITIEQTHHSLEHGDREFPQREYEGSSKGFLPARRGLQIERKTRDGKDDFIGDFGCGLVDDSVDVTKGTCDWSFRNRSAAQFVRDKNDAALAGD